MVLGSCARKETCSDCWRFCELDLLPHQNLEVITTPRGSFLAEDDCCLAHSSLSHSSSKGCHTFAGSRCLSGSGAAEVFCEVLASSWGLNLVSLVLYTTKFGPFRFLLHLEVEVQALVGKGQTPNRKAMRSCCL